MGARGAFKKKNKEAAFPNSGQHAENQRLVPHLASHLPCAVSVIESF